MVKSRSLASPVGYAIVLLVVLPITGLFENLFPTYSIALASWWAVGWPVLLAVCILSILLALVCYRRHKCFSETGALTWSIFVFLFGLPGLIGYLLHRRWPVTEKCQHCGEITPRDRDACLDCGTEFPLPPLKGIEIFA